MQIISENDFVKARDLIRKNKGQVIFTSDDDDLNRKILEKEKISILLINQKNRRDFQKQRNSGFNQVIAKLVKKNNVLLGINFDEISESHGREKAEVLARIKQNIVLCNKNKINMVFISKDNNKRNVHDLKALGLVLGMPTWMTKKL